MSPAQRTLLSKHLHSDLGLVLFCFVFVIGVVGLSTVLDGEGILRLSSWGLNYHISVPGDVSAPL